MKIKQDLHIHSHHSFDSACAALPDIREDREALGLEHFAVTDHLNTRYSLSDLESCRHDFLRFGFGQNFHFGVELALIAQWEADRIDEGDFIPGGLVPLCGFRSDPRPFDGRIAIALRKEDIVKYGLEVVIGGVHWPLGTPKSRSEVIDNYFEQHLFLAENPLIDIVAHPWDSIAAAASDRFNHPERASDHTIYKEIPQEMDDTLGKLFVQNGKLAEINLPATLQLPEEVMHLCMSRYARWRESGVKFTIGSDQHSPRVREDFFVKMEKLLDDYGFTEEDFALPFSEFQAHYQ